MLGPSGISAYGEVGVAGEEDHYGDNSATAVMQPYGM